MDLTGCLLDLSVVDTRDRRAPSSHAERSLTLSLGPTFLNCISLKPSFNADSRHHHAEGSSHRQNYQTIFPPWLLVGGVEGCSHRDSMVLASHQRNLVAFLAAEARFSVTRKRLTSTWPKGLGRRKRLEGENVGQGTWCGHPVPGYFRPWMSEEPMFGRHGFSTAQQNHWQCLHAMLQQATPQLSSWLLVLPPWSGADYLQPLTSLISVI
ncbi:hypothetical protein QBC43DRAFT_94213 [Cladorrhinum sp. PSN259]|nr:hypothetical protein QBC43DRAFT_94213 [Cladorrhinum sp. PSN259]